MSTFWESTPVLDAVLIWHNAGCNVFPAIPDKRPMGNWKKWQTTPITWPTLQDWYQTNPHYGIGLICGQASGNLEMLELEGRACSGDNIDLIQTEADQRQVGHIWKSFVEDGYAEWTPSGGLHFLYRITDHPVPGNTKIAQRPATEEELAENPDDRIKVLSETRGEGGYVVVAPTAGHIHPTGESWTVATGQLGVINNIDWHTRNMLIEAIHAALDQMPAVEERPPTPAPATPVEGTRPGDDFNHRATWDEILQPHGWTIHHRTLQETYWTRPGKRKIDGWSATTGHAADADRLYVFSSATVFTPETPYNKFTAYTLLEHHGDYTAAARTLGRMGYGSPLVPSTTSAYVAHPVSTEALASPVQPATDSTELVPRTTAVAKRVYDAEGLPCYRNDDFAAMRWDGASVAQKWRELHTDTFKFVPAAGKWMMWQGDRWGWDLRLRHEHAAVQMVERMRNYAYQVEQTDADLGKAMVKEARRMCTAQNVQSTIKMARSHPTVVADHADFDAHPNLLTVENGIFNLSTMELQPHDPRHMLTRKINATHNPAAAAGRWGTFMEEILPDPAVRDYVQRACGYMLQGNVTERVMFLLYGESGTGKTQFLEAINAVLGDFAGIAPASAFQPRQHGYKGPSEDLHKLMGKRFVMQSELDAGTKLNESLVKSIVGADTQTTRPLYGDPIDWRPEYTVFMATNYLPRISSSDNAIWNRVKPIKFCQTFIDDKGQVLNPADRNIGRRLAETEADTILQWLLQGLQMYREQGLSEPDQVGMWLQEYRDDVDTTRQFMIEAPEEGRITVQTGVQVGVRDLYRVYHAWCVDNALTPVGSKTFNERLRSSGWKKEKKEKGIMWQGVGLTGFLMQAQQPATKSWHQ